MKTEIKTPPEVPISALKRTFSSLQIRHYRFYWLSTLFNFLAMQMQMVARGWLIYEMTDSPLALGLMGVAWGIPALILTPLGGVLADRINRRKMIVISQIAIVLVTAIVTILITAGQIQYSYLIIAALITGVCDAMNMPARQAMVPHLVDSSHLLNAIALNSSAINVTRIIGPAIAGILVGVIGMSGVYIIITLFYIAALGALIMLPNSKPIFKDKNTTMLKEFLTGLRYVRSNSAILALLTMAIVSTMLGWPYMVLMPVFAGYVLQMGAEGLGMLMSASGCGALIGSLSIASITQLKNKGRLLLALGIVFGVALILFAGSESYYLSLVFVFAVGLVSAAYYALQNTLIQSNIKDETRGRVMSIFQMTFSMQTIGTLFISGIAEKIGIFWAIGGGGMLFVIIMIAFSILKPELRRL